MSRCCACRLEVPENGLYVTCSECKFKFHIGGCSGVSADSFTGKRDGTKKHWKCDTCRGPTQKENGATGKQKIDINVASQLVELNTKLDSLLTLPTKIGELEASVQVLSDKFDEFQARLASQEKVTQELTKRVQKLEGADSTKELTQLQLDVNGLEYHSRRLNVEIHGVQETEKEDLLTKVNEIAKQIKVPPLSRNDVEAIHRLPAKPGKTRAIIVRFTRQELRDSWLANKKELKKENKNTYICESLTRLARVLLSKAKEWQLESGYQFVWYSYGKVRVRKAIGDRVIVVRDERDLAALK